MQSLYNAQKNCSFCKYFDIESICIRDYLLLIPKHCRNN